MAWQDVAGVAGVSAAYGAPVGVYVAHKNRKDGGWNWGHRLSNAGESALSWGSSGAGIGSLFGPKGTAIGGGVGAAIGFLKGLLSDTELQELADTWARGEIDPATEMRIKRMVADRFSEIRRNQGGRLARGGVRGSSMAERLLAETDANERGVLTDALTNASLALQDRGLSLKAQQAAQRGEIVGGSVDNLMALASGFKADERYAQEREDLQGFRQELLGLMGDGGGNTTLSPVDAKAAAMVGKLPAGTGRGKGGSGVTSTWGDLNKKYDRSVTQKRTGGGSYWNRNANPGMSGSRQRGTWNVN